MATQLPKIIKNTSIQLRLYFCVLLNFVGTFQTFIIYVFATPLTVPISHGHGAVNSACNSFRRFDFVCSVEIRIFLGRYHTYLIATSIRFDSESRNNDWLLFHPANGHVFVVPPLLLGMAKLHGI